MNMARIGLVAAALVLSLLGGCSDKKAAPATPMSAAGAYAGNPQPAQGRSAAEVAQSARKDLRCPAEVTLPARPENQPVDDLMGIRPGMRYEEAANVILCTDDLLTMSKNDRRGFSLETYGTKLRQGFEMKPAAADMPMTQEALMARMREESRQRNSFVRVRDVPPGHSKWAVGTMGLPGEEKVISVIREQWFETDKLPPAATVEQALTKKYGEPTARNRHDAHALTWAFDTRGRPITETSRLYETCRIASQMDARLTLSPDCGLIIAARLNPPHGNDQLVEFLEIHIADQAGGFTAIRETQEGLLSLNESRKARELEQAAGNSDEVKL